jgi:predicted amidohydrolase YtcJ
MKIGIGLIAAGCVAAAHGPAALANTPAADLIVEHAKIWTVDESRPEAQAVAVLQGRIVAVGSDADVGAWRGAGTQVVDAQGKRLLPGFNDAHVHFSDGGASLRAVQLNDAASLGEFVRRIAAQAKRMAPGEWLREGEWDET